MLTPFSFQTKATLSFVNFVGVAVFFTQMAFPGYVRTNTS
jgi:hypothetical protein